jgi:DNA-binding CsgD family transcriptional regulator
VVQTFSALDFFEASAATEGHHYQVRLNSWERFAESSAAPCALARLSHARGLLGATLDESESHLATALTYHEASRRPVERARTELALGAMLRRNRQRTRARAHLRNAYQGFARVGLPQWSARAAHELRATGETVRHGVEARSDQLTPQERQVAMCVADGLSNRDVAARLVLSPRTVEFHLRNVFGKLGVASRTELAKIVSSDLAFRV